MKDEGTHRLYWVLPEPLKAEGIEVLGDPRRGRHTSVLAVCYDDWENGAREQVRALIDRKA